MEPLTSFAEALALAAGAVAVLDNPHCSSFLLTGDALDLIRFVYPPVKAEALRGEAPLSLAWMAPGS